MKRKAVQGVQPNVAKLKTISVAPSSMARKLSSLPGVLLLFVLAVVHQGAYANVYKCERADGKVEYQADPCANGREITSKVNRPPPVTSVAHVASATDKKQCVGKEIRINFSNMPLRSTLQVLADYSGNKLIADPTVSGAGAFNYECVHWDAVLQDVASRHDLVVKVENGAIYARKR